MKISLIITTYNNPVFLEMVLLSVQKQVFRKNPDTKLEVIIADDGSLTPTRELIIQYQKILSFPLLHVWQEDDGFRASRIRNLAVKATSSEYIIFIDGDCVLPPDFIDMHLELKEEGFLVSGGRILLSENYTNYIIKTKNIVVTNSSILFYLYYKITGKINKVMPWLRLNTKAAWRKKSAYDWKKPKSCNLGLFKNDYLRVNGFDESFIGWGHEDSDIVIRLLHAGVLIKNGRFAASVFHLWHRENSRWQKSNNYERLLHRIKDAEFIKAEVGINDDKSCN